MTLLEAAEALSIILHQLEARGVEPTEEEDKTWLEVTDTIQKEYSK